MKQWLLNHEIFPHVQLGLVDGRTIALPDDIDGEFTLLVIYRAHWCPDCRRQFASFKPVMKTLADGGMRVIFCSGDPLDRASEIAADLGCEMAFGMTRALSDQLGTGWVETHISNEGHPPYGEIKAHAQPTSFLMARNGRILSSTYSSGASFGTLKGEDVARRLNWLLTYPRAWRPDFGLPVESAA